MEGEVHVLQHYHLLLQEGGQICAVAGAEKRGGLRGLHKERAKKLHSPNNHPLGGLLSSFSCCVFMVFPWGGFMILLMQDPALQDPE